MLQTSTKIKKSFALSLTAVTALSLILAGCGGNNNNEEASSSPSASPSESASAPASESASPSPSESAAAPELKEYKLSFFLPGTPPKDEVKVETEINKYLKEKINATLDINFVDWGQWDNKMNLAIASRDPMDIIFTASWNGHSANVAKGAFLPLNDASGKYGNLLEQYGQDILSSLPEAFLKGAKINGFNYGIPANKELAEQGGIVYRKDVADELGLTDKINAVKTIADLEPILAEVKAKKPDMIPIFMRDGENFNAHYFAKYDYLGDTTIDGVIMKDGTDTVVKSRYDQPRYLETLKITREFFEKGYINKDAATTQLGVNDALKKGNVFMVPSPLKPGKDAELASATGLSGKLAQVAMTERTVATSDTAGSMLGISTTSGDPARAMMLINLLHSDKYLNNLINFGIEGDHYSRNGEIISLTDNTPNYSIGAAWMLGNQMINYVWDTEAPDKWDQFKKFNEGAHNSPALGFTFNAEPVKSQASVMNNTRRQYDPGLDTGSVDPAKAEEYFKKLKSNGLDDVIAEKQKQLDAFLASNK
ncbi:ABC transporter substrate-binding protein [Cohnella thailandensis]|uniref:ABC transporter substrate-binding protein n=1 Tax=Cohnella thailandensis TaxID=557557 RepID=A0A841SXN0_9BACL|nr:ABC transporter substrate-binding protein [Cohnella thailandensis]MBB6635679.1 ABC transporter substrate-binding protein [Cohnella thailandensis]MBP1976056.1 putative aldouronate transport system substrate-binding protein [Cohnella thailandensis]